MMVVIYVVIVIALCLWVMWWLGTPDKHRQLRFTRTITINTISLIINNLIMLELQNDQFVEVQSQLTDDDGQAVEMTDFSVVSNDPSVASVGDVTQLENGTMQYDVIGTIGNVGATVIVETATTPDGQVVTNEYAVSTLPNPVGFVRTFGEPQNQ